MSTEWTFVANSSCKRDEDRKENATIKASQKIQSLSWMTFIQAKTLIEKAGFHYNGRTPDSYDKFHHADWSDIQIIPNGEVIKTRKLWKEDWSWKFPQRYDENGNPTSSHNPGEFILR